jgi:hypothetical protein
MGPGDAKVAPLKDEALRLATLVVLATLSGAVPSATVEVICPLAEMLVNVPLFAPSLPTGPVKDVEVRGPTEFVQEALTPSDVSTFPTAPV